MFWMADPDNSTVIAGVTIPVILLLCGVFVIVLMRRKGRRNGNVASSCLGKDSNHRGADGLSLPDGVIETTYVLTDLNMTRFLESFRRMRWWTMSSLFTLVWLQTAGETEGFRRALPSYGRRFGFPFLWRIRLFETRWKGSAVYGGRFTRQPA